LGGGIQLGPLGTSATDWLILPAPSDYDGEIGGMMIGRGNRSTRKEPGPVSLCPPHIPHDLTRRETRAAAVGAPRQKFINGIVVGGVVWGALGTAATNRSTVPAPGDYDDGEIGGMMIKLN
jgi:hypothetical protein